MGMAVSMSAMMVPTAAPFFFAYGRDTRRPVAIATVVLIYVAAWAAIGLALDYVMRQIMMPSPLLVVAIALALALAYAVTPWGRWAREQCRQMSRRREPRGQGFRDAIAEGASYAACCVVCSAGVMLVVIVLGMSNPLVIVAGAVVILSYKLIPWPAPAFAAGE
jgi:predicted metal-binding membrane protein